MKYAILYSNNDGSSHFRDAKIDFELVNFAPPAPLVGLSSYIPVSQMVFFRLPAGWFGDWHCPPKKQFFCCLTGEVELTASDGEKRSFRSSDIFLLEDITGKGHQTKVSSKDEFTAAIVQLQQTIDMHTD